MSVVILDRFASILFVIFVLVEWKFGDNDKLAWNLRLLWLGFGCLGVGTISLFTNEPIAVEIPKKPDVIIPTPPLLAATVEEESTPLPPPATIVPATPLPAPHTTFPSPLPPATSFSTPNSTSSYRSLRSRFSLKKSTSSPIATTTPKSSSSSRSFRKRLFGLKKSPTTTTTTPNTTTPTLDLAPPFQVSFDVEEEESKANATVIQSPPTLPPVVEAAATGGVDRFGFGPPAPPPPAGYVYTNTQTWGYLGHLTEKEDAVLQEMKKKSYSCKESVAGTYTIDDVCLLRFLRARKFDLDKADKMFSAHLLWRDKFMPTTLTPNDVSQVLGSGLVRFGPTTKEFLPVIMVKVEFMDPNQFESLDFFTRYVAYFFECGIKKLPSGADKAFLFFDMNGWSLRKHATPFAMRLVLELVHIIQAQNPERLFKCMLFNTPMMFSSTWRVIKSWLDPVVAAKIQFVSDTATVLEHIASENLPVEYGGSRVLPYPIEGYADMHKE